MFGPDRRLYRSRCKARPDLNKCKEPGFPGPSIAVWQVDSGCPLHLRGQQRRYPAHDLADGAAGIVHPFLRLPLLQRRVDEMTALGVEHSDRWVALDHDAHARPWTRSRSAGA